MYLGFEFGPQGIRDLAIVVVVVDPFIFTFFVINETIFTRAYDLSL